MKKYRWIIAAAVLILLIGCGYVGRMFGVFSEGNYGLSAKEPVQGSVLEGKTVLFLGSSVTYGYGSFGVSFADYFAELYGVNAVKEAVSGTTLADINEKSYVARLKKTDPSLRPDAFVCQLSTNDATKGIPLGTVANGFECADFDTSTVAGAIEYIIAYVRETWRCPVVFYTQAKYDSAAYADMVLLLEKVREKWGIHVIDLWNDAAINDITPEERKRYLVDATHPTKAGYRDWWLPVMAKSLAEVFA